MTATVPCNAVEKLNDAQSRTGSLLSIGLEPAFDYLPDCYPQTIEGQAQFLSTIIRATSGFCCAYKFNLAFFEALGVRGASLLHSIREKLPSDVLVIADAKRGDIGSTAKQYARAIYEELNADSTTLNPLMGFDSAEPFLEHSDKLNYFLVATSNPGAADFLLAGDLYLRIAERVRDWNSRGNCGFVVGATRDSQIRAIRAIAPSIPFLVPGLGAQGGDLKVTLREGASEGGPTNLLLHVTRGILPARSEPGDIEEIIRQKTMSWNERVREAITNAGPRMSVEHEAEDLLKGAGALKSGHFQLTSGLHSDRYCQCATLFEQPELADKVAQRLATVMGGTGRIDTVLTPAIGGILWGYELARQLGARSLFAERQPGERFTLRRGFTLAPGERVLLAEDVITTGKSVLELIPLVEAAGAVVVGFAAVADRSRGGFQPGPPVYTLAKLAFDTWEPAQCPLCAKGMPIDKPGSRVMKTSSTA
ncbi:orotate phosphoribosyltransferase [Candidatus Sumerlaeota bacterium]|nr:orotate phosphoribosyltransferase [Candidatus Sumerlaeota bacterium]